MRRFLHLFLLLLLICGLAPALVGCGPSTTSEEAAREMVQEEDAQADIEAELAEEMAENQEDPDEE